MGPIQAPLFPIRILKLAIWFTVFFYLFFLIFNTSFTIMGVDVGDFLKQYLGAFFGVYLSTTFKVFSVSLFLHLSLFSLVYLTYHFLKQSDVSWIHLSAWVVFIECLALLHSMVSYPQIYGEFFFFRYPTFAPFLYFLTDHTSPGYFTLVLGILILVFLSVLSLQIYLHKNKESFFVLVHVLILGLVHISGYYMVGIFYFAILFWQGKQYQRIHIKSYGIILFLLILFYLVPGIWTRIEAFTHSNEKEKPPVFIIAADSLRYDKIGYKIGGKSITPKIDLFAKDGFVFHDHHTTIPRTFPSWADLLTGQYAMSHKVRDMFPSPEEKKRIGSPAFSTIQQKLKEIGYRSYAIGSFAADIFPRANFGFDEVHAPNFNARIMTVQRTAESQLFLMPFLTGSWFSGGMYLEEMDGLSTWGDGSRILDRFRSVLHREGKDSFSVTYFSSVIHFPYTPAYPYYKTFTDPNYYGKYKYLKFVDPTNSTTPDELETKQIRGLFDSAVFAFDSEFGEIISELKDKEIYDEAIIILTADHGEALYEDVHGQGHGEHLRGEAVTHVPFIIKFPKSTNPTKPDNEFFGITSSVDIYPTLMEYFNLTTKQKFPGRSLLPMFGKSNWEDDRLVYAETGIWFSDAGDHFFQKQRIPYPNILSLHQVIPEEDYQIMITDPIYRETIAFSKHRSVQNSNYKLIYIPTRQGVVFELYDRKKDPLNTKNLYPNHPMATKMKDMLYQTVIQWEDASLAGEYLIPSSLSDINEN
ncbi:sulfatase [Leptospira noumeaensis]|uniref:Sulfatase n=1 Tax=Leptospira noumeaensis TaxID=2484964 RepID=A0A4R9IHK9_9LEPT|nr:sulfatase-like hydrolase/transferase [Leptospira noumeaensis]TGK87097.1 sulfatase [Leptospira noumeaensis]